VSENTVKPHRSRNIVTIVNGIEVSRRSGVSNQRVPSFLDRILDDDITDVIPLPQCRHL